MSNMPFEIICLNYILDKVGMTAAVNKIIFMRNKQVLRTWNGNLIQNRTMHDHENHENGLKSCWLKEETLEYIFHPGFCF